MMSCLRCLICFIAVPSIVPSVFAFEDVTRVASKDIPQEIFQYIARPEPDFAWNLVETQDVSDCKVYRLELTSQKWQDIVWKHALIVFEPKKIVHPDHMLLFVTGGSIGNYPAPKDMGLGIALANFCGARIATLHQVPNQPLMGDRSEDECSAATRCLCWRGQPSAEVQAFESQVQ